MDLSRIKSLREDSDITQAEVATYLNIAQNTYSNYENGMRQFPIDTLISLSRYYRVNLEYLLCLTDDPRPMKKARS